MPQVGNPLGSLRAVNTPRFNRKLRHPQHTFNIEVRPWQIQPFMIAPVLPGETLKNLLLQARTVSDPIKDPLVGWWAEWMYFYVKHTDLDARDTFMDMHLDPSTLAAVTALKTGTIATESEKYFHSGFGGNTLNWAKLCLKRVVEDYFRNDGETWNTNVIDLMPVCSINQLNVLDSALNDAERATQDVPVVDGSDANSTLDASEVDVAMRTWQFLVQGNMTEMTFQDYLATFGVRRSSVEIRKPELVRHIRDWTYPTSVIEPTTGVPSSAVSWKTAERADKDRFFKEPGFLLGICVFRPKVYLRLQSSTFANQLDNAFMWLPAVMRDDLQVSYRKIAALTTPLNTNTDAYWVDMKDLFMYGEQYVNYAMASVKSQVALPTAALQKRYADSTMADLLFTAASPANKIRSDGVTSLSIASAITDTSATR